MTFNNFKKVCHNRRKITSGWDKKIGHIFTRPPGISHIQFIFNLLHTDTDVVFKINPIFEDGLVSMPDPC